MELVAYLTHTIGTCFDFVPKDILDVIALLAAENIVFEYPELLYSTDDDARSQVKQAISQFTAPSGGSDGENHGIYVAHWPTLTKKERKKLKDLRNAADANAGMYTTGTKWVFVYLIQAQTSLTFLRCKFESEESEQRDVIESLDLFDIFDEPEF